MWIREAGHVRAHWETRYFNAKYARSYRKVRQVLILSYEMGALQ
jgi:hypothetical protein